jgi:hypothetical protein
MSVDPPHEVAGLEWVRSAPAALLFRVLARLDLGPDAASLYDPSLPAAPWTTELAAAYAAAPGRHALQWIALDAPDLATLQSRLQGLTGRLADVASRALTAEIADALPAWIADTAAAVALAAARAEVLSAPLARLRAALWERAGSPPPLRVIDVPALRRCGRGLRGDVHRVAVDLRQDPDHLLCQIFHEEVHVRTDPAVLTGTPPVPRDTRAGTPGHAVHAALEDAAVTVGEAVIAARAPEHLAAYHRWRAQWT